jgi:superfamily II DNA helicase RecQ
LLALKLYLDEADATFKCYEQGIALSHALMRDKDMIVSLPTGFRKTAVMFAPSTVEPSMVTVAIPLFKSLIAQYTHLLTAAGIHFILYVRGVTTIRNFDMSVKVLIAQAEDCNTIGFRSLLTNLHQQSRLARICIDEVHEMQNAEGGFRNHLQFFCRTYEALIGMSLICFCLPPLDQHSVRNLKMTFFASLCMRLGLNSCLATSSLMW